MYLIVRIYYIWMVIIMKSCKKCNKELQDHEFHKLKTGKMGLNSQCRKCRAVTSNRRYRLNPFNQLCRSKRSDSKKKGLDFNLTEGYLRDLWTGVCPIFNIPIAIGLEGSGCHKSAHLDRLIPEKGYVMGNVTYICSRANMIKYNATVEELRLVADWIEGSLNEQRLS